jgi:maltose O-acetyltransferase
MEDSSELQQKTDKQKMLAGELYQAFTPELLEERLCAKELCFEYNQTRPRDSQKRTEILRKLLGSIEGDDILIEAPFQCDYGYNIHVGRNFYANHGCTILDCSTVKIGDNCLMGPHVVISGASHPLDAQVRAAGDELAGPVTIGDNVWIGASATILMGVTIGDGVVVGAGAVVTRDIPDNCVCAGVPARIVKRIDSGGRGDDSTDCRS